MDKNLTESILATQELYNIYTTELFDNLRSEKKRIRGDSESPQAKNFEKRMQHISEALNGANDLITLLTYSLKKANGTAKYVVEQNTQLETRLRLDKIVIDSYKKDLAKAQRQTARADFRDAIKSGNGLEFLKSIK